MIYVKELVPPTKMSGLSSFAITPEYYSREVYEIISKLTVNRYDPTKTKKDPHYYLDRDGYWEISSVDIRSFLEHATKLDDIHLELYEKDFNEALSEKEVSSSELDNFKIKPLKHQLDVINFTLTKKNKWLLLDSMGLGKSASIIYTASILKSRGLIDHCLIICCVNAIKENWANEIEKFSNESYLILGKKVGKRGGVSYAPVAERIQILKNPIKEFFVIMNIEILSKNEVVEAIQKSKNNFGMIAVDEIHMSNNKNSHRGEGLLKLKADYKIAATGTLITNNPTSAYLPLAWTDNDKSVLGTFRPQYEIQDEHKRVIGYKNLELLHEEIESCSLRRTLTEVRDDMPPKTVTYEYIYLDKAHRDFYENIKKGVIDDAAKVELNNSNLLALTTRLRQAAVCPMILTDTVIKSTKLERCCELVDELISQDEKVVILSNFVESVKQLANMLKQYNPLLCLGELKDDVVAHNNKLFQEDPSYKLVMGTHQRMGTGLTFNAASYLIMLDSPWTYAAFSQSSDRIWRVNNTRPAYIKVLVDSDTIDERVMELVETKKELGEILVDGKEVKMTKSMSDELRKIIKEL